MKEQWKLTMPLKELVAAHNLFSCLPGQWMSLEGLTSQCVAITFTTPYTMEVPRDVRVGLLFYIYRTHPYFFLVYYL